MISQHVDDFYFPSLRTQLPNAVACIVLPPSKLKNIITASHKSPNQIHYLGPEVGCGDTSLMDNSMIPVPYSNRLILSL